MDKFSIEGPSRIRGEVKISGSKNSSLPILAATLLFNQPVVLKNLPKVNDINTMISLLRSLGSKIILSKDKNEMLVSFLNDRKNSYIELRTGNLSKLNDFYKYSKHVNNILKLILEILNPHNSQLNNNIIDTYSI